MNLGIHDLHVSHVHASGGPDARELARFHTASLPSSRWRGANSFVQVLRLLYL